MSVISLTVTGRMHTVDVDPAAPPLYMLYVLSCSTCSATIWSCAVRSSDAA